MDEPEKKFIYKDGLRFEVRPDGLFYVPEKRGASKHDCPDCFFCQWCADVRCVSCRKQGRRERA